MASLNKYLVEHTGESEMPDVNVLCEMVTVQVTPPHVAFIVGDLVVYILPFDKINSISHLGIEDVVINDGTSYVFNA